MLKENDTFLILIIILKILIRIVYALRFNSNWKYVLNKKTF